MARFVSDREDLLREATALVERVELALPGRTEHVVAGFRRDGSASFYFGSEPVYQFNSSGELRRAYSGGLMIKAERGGLVSLRRHRAQGQVQLLRHELTARETADLVSRAAGDMRALGELLRTGDFKVVGQVPPDGQVVLRAGQWLDRLETIVVARSPGIS